MFKKFGVKKKVFTFAAAFTVICEDTKSKVQKNPLLNMSRKVKIIRSQAKEKSIKFFDKIFGGNDNHLYLCRPFDLYNQRGLI